MRYLKIIIGVLVIIIGVIFVLQNKDLQRPISLGFDPLYMFKAQETPARTPAPAPPPATVTIPPASPVPGEDKLGSGDSAETGDPATGGGAQTSAPAQPGPAGSEPIKAEPAPYNPEGASGIPAFILIFLAFFVGILVASLFGIMEKFRLKKVVKRGAARVRELEEELKDLRNLPLNQPTTQPIIAPPQVLSEPQEEPDEFSGPPEDGETKEEG